MTKSPMIQSPKTKPSRTTRRRQPPVEKQFKPGQSGNPAGRPKGSRNKVTRGAFARIVLEEAARAAPGSPGVTMHRAVIRNLYLKAAMDGLGAAELILTLAAEAEALAADVDDAAEIRAAGAADAERRRREAAEDEALATRLAAADPDLYRTARKFAPLNDRSSTPMRFTDAVARARTYVALNLDPYTKYDPFELAAALVVEQKNGSDEDDDDA